jgi:hypothetical protein
MMGDGSSNSRHRARQDPRVGSLGMVVDVRPYCLSIGDWLY